MLGARFVAAARSAGTAARSAGTAGRLAGTAVAAVTLALVGVLATAAPVRAENTFVEVTPNTAQAGARVSIRASCDTGNNSQANVESEAFGRVVVRPDNGFLTGSVTIPNNKVPGQYGVNLRCPNGSTATTTLSVVNMSKPTQGPATGAGGTAGGGGGGLVFAGAVAAVAAVGALWLVGVRRGRARAGG